MRKPPDVLVEEPAEVGDGEAGQTLVLEQKQQLGFRRGAGTQAHVTALQQERGLPAAAHADDGERLAGDRRQPHVPARQVPGRGRQRFVELEPHGVARYRHYQSDSMRKTVTP